MAQKANVNVFLVLLDDNKHLLLLRQNTGYEDGKWSFVGGHVETNESAVSALIRESYEEAGIILKPSDLSTVHIMHRKTNRENIDIFMACNGWSGEISNKEPEKCGGLAFFHIDSLPNNTIDCKVKVLRDIKDGKFYSEYGWI
jgi:8-oxo-dGTP diphosphatase